MTTEQIKQLARELVKSAPQGEMCKWALDALQQAYVAGRASAGGRGALKAFGAEGTEEEMKQQILAWRAASPAIVEFWGGQSRDFGRTPGMFGLEGAAVQAVLNPGQREECARILGEHK